VRQESCTQLAKNPTFPLVLLSFANSKDSSSISYNINLTWLVCSRKLALHMEGSCSRAEAMVFV